MLKLIRGCALAITLAVALTPAQAQNYPDKPIRLIVAFVAGGATDTLARQLQNDLQEALGQPVMHRKQARRRRLHRMAASPPSDPDGHTLLLAENALAISQALYKRTKSTFDPITQYDAVTGIAISPSALVVANNIPANNVKELLAYSKTVERGDELRLRRHRSCRIELRSLHGQDRHEGRAFPTRAAARRSATWWRATCR